MKSISYFIDHIDEVVDVEYVPINKDIDQSINLIIPSYNGHMINIIAKEEFKDNTVYTTYNFIIGTDCDYIAASKLLDQYQSNKNKL